MGQCVWEKSIHLSVYKVILSAFEANFTALRNLQCIQSLTKFARKLFFAGSHFSDVNTFINHSAHFLFIIALGYLMSLAKYSDKVTLCLWNQVYPIIFPFEVHFVFPQKVQAKRINWNHD